MEATPEELPFVLRFRREALGKTFAVLKEEINTQHPKVLSIGCGFGYEAEPILRVFPEGTYTGIDINSSLIYGARGTNRDVGKAVFKVADATRQEAFGNEPWDLVILRHPQVITYMSYKVGMDRNWGKIMDNSINATRKDGIIFITSSSEPEQKIIQKYLSSLGQVSIIRSGDNINKAEVGTFQDDLIIVARKL